MKTRGQTQAALIFSRQTWCCSASYFSSKRCAVAAASVVRRGVNTSGGGHNYVSIRIRFDRDSTSVRLQLDRATTIRRPTLRPDCCTAAEVDK